MPGRGSKTRRRSVKSRGRARRRVTVNQVTVTSTSEAPEVKERSSLPNTVEQGTSISSVSTDDAPTPEKRRRLSLNTESPSYADTRQRIELEKSSIQSQIRSSAQKALDAIKKKEEQLMGELDDITEKQMEKEFKMICKTASSDIYQSCDTYKEYRKTRVVFVQEVDKTDKVLEELQLGEIQVISEDRLDSVSRPVLSDTIDCTLKKDEKKPGISSLASMDINGVDTLIVTDCYNNCIKSFFKRNNKPSFSCLKVKSTPWRLSKLEDNKIAVTFPEMKKIITFNVTPSLSLLSTINTEKPYKGLTVLTPTTLAASSDRPSSVDILDRSGNVLRSISPFKNRKRLIISPYFLSATKNGNVLVSDWGTKSVLCLTPKGDVVFIYSPRGEREIQDPSGITVTDSGNILIADRIGDKVIQLNESGEFVRDLLTQSDGLKTPHSLEYKRGSIRVRYDIENIQTFRLN